MKLNRSAISPEIWSATIGEPLTLTEFSGRRPMVREGDDFTKKSPNFIQVEQRSDSTVLRIPMAENEIVFGCGLHCQKTICNHEVFHLRVDHSNGDDTGRSHAAVPFFVTTAGYGLFLDTPCAVSCYIGTTQRLADKTTVRETDRVTNPDWSCFAPPYFIEIAVQSSALKLVCFYGKSMKECVAKFNLYCGGGCLPPRWGFGFHFRVNMKSSAGTILKQIEEFDAHGFHPDVLGLEPGWQSNSYPCTYEWSERIPDPEQFCETLRKRQIRVNLWENLCVLLKCSIYRELLPYAGPHLVWRGIVPDYTLPQALELLKRHHDLYHFHSGVSGYKLDRKRRDRQLSLARSCSISVRTGRVHLPQSLRSSVSASHFRNLPDSWGENLRVDPCDQRRRSGIPLCALQRPL